MKKITIAEKLKRISAMQKKIDKGYQLKFNPYTYKDVLLFVDVETIGYYGCPKEENLPFDISYKLLDNKTMLELDYGTLLVKEIYEDKEKISTPFCVKKVPKYYKDKIEKQKTTKLMTIEEIGNFFKKMINEYNIKIIVAYNGAFDYESLNRLFYQNGFESPFAKLNFLDLGHFVCMVFKDNKDYKTFCFLNDYHYNKNKVCRVPVEIIGKFILGKSFEEQHTGLKDLEVELLIYKYLKLLSNNLTLKLNRQMKTDKSLVTC